MIFLLLQYMPLACLRVSLEIPGNTVRLAYADHPRQIPSALFHEPVILMESNMDIQTLFSVRDKVVLVTVLPLYPQPN